jgi:hypothetical protein
MKSKDLQSILEECRKQRTPVFIASQSLDIAFQTVIRHVDGNTIILENMVRPEYIQKFSAGNLFFLQCKMLRLQSTKVGPRGTNMAFEIQENSTTEETRQAERFLFTPDEKVMAEILNPFDNITKLHRHVMDMSATGLSIRINAPTKPFAAGAKLPLVKVHIDGKLWTTASAEVVYNRKFMDLQGHLRVQVGLKFLTSQNAPR